jgi:hypothetical protein
MVDSHQKQFPFIFKRLNFNLVIHFILRSQCCYHAFKCLLVFVSKELIILIFCVMVIFLFDFVANIIYIDFSEYFAFYYIFDNPKLI